MNSKKISKVILLLGLVSLITDISSEIIIPLLPFFLAEIGASALIVGLIGGVEEGAVGVLNLVSGYASGKKEKKKGWVFSGYFISALSKLGLALSALLSFWPIALLFRTTDRAGKGIRKAPRDTMIAKAAEKRGFGFGVHRAMDTTGAIVGAALAFLLFCTWKWGYLSIFLLAGVIGFFGLIPLIFLKEKGGKINPRGFAFSLRSLPRESLIIIGLITLFDMGNFTYMIFMLRAGSLTAVRIALLLYLLYNASYAALSIPFGSLSDRVGKHKILTVGYSLYALTCIGFVFSSGLSLLVPLFILYGAFMASVDSVQRAYISDIVPEDLRSTALGTIHMALALATIPASLIAGFLMTIAPQAPFIYGASIGAISAVLIFAYGRRINYKA
jgi:Major Facilitator Superfamily.